MYIRYTLPLPSTNSRMCATCMAVQTSSPASEPGSVQSEGNLAIRESGPAATQVPDRHR